MHVFLLIVALAGGPEKIVAICNTYKQCSDTGHEAAVLYVRQFNKLPRDYSYRVIPGLVLPDLGAKL